MDKCIFVVDFLLTISTIMCDTFIKIKVKILKSVSFSMDNQFFFNYTLFFCWWYSSILFNL